MRKIILRFVLIFCFLLPGMISAQNQNAPQDGWQRPLHDELLDHLTGTWRSSGTARNGEPFVHDFKIEWVLNHQFLRIHEKATTPSKNGLQYEVMAMLGYDNASERYVVHWIDVFGGRWSETLGYGRRSGNTIEFIFEYPDGPFKTSLEWQPKTNSWHWHMTQKNAAGAWEDFAEYTMTSAQVPAK